MTDRPPTACESAPDTAVAAPDEDGSGTDTTLAAAAADDAATDLGRTDTTNTTLASLSGVLLTVLTAGAGLTSSGGTYPTPALVAVGAAAILLATALVVLTTALWPRAGGTGGVPHYAAHSPDSLQAELAETATAQWYAERAVTKARIASRKHTAQRIAAAALAGAGLLLALATIATLATA